MFKKTCLLFILILSPYILAMEENTHPKVPPIQIPRRPFFRHSSLSTTLQFPPQIEDQAKEKERKNSLDQKPPYLREKSKSLPNMYMGPLSKMFSRENSPNKLSISPRGENAYCLFLQLPDELLLHIIFQILDSINLDLDQTEIGETDVLRFKEVKDVVFPFKVTCTTIRRLVPEEIFNFYLIKLDNYSNKKKIEWAERCYSHGHFSSVGFLLTSILNKLGCKKLIRKNRILLKFIKVGLLSISNKSLQFKLGSDKEGFKLGSDVDENLELINILLELVPTASLHETPKEDESSEYETSKEDESSEENLITTNRLFFMVLTSKNNYPVLDYLINLYNLPNNYITTDLMRAAFNGDTDYLAPFCNKQITDHFEKEPEKEKDEVDCQELFRPNPEKLNAIIWAFIGGKKKFLNYIVSYVPKEKLIEINELHRNLVHYTTLYASPKTLKYLLSKLMKFGENNIILLSLINAEDNTNNIPLSLAIRNDDEDKVLILINYGANVDLLKNCDLPQYEGRSELLKTLCGDKSLFKRLNDELKIVSEEPISAERLIECCKKCQKEKTSSIRTIVVLFFSIVGLIFYGES